MSPAKYDVHTLGDLFHLWFGLDKRVGRRVYFFSGLFLFGLKYLLEAMAIYIALHRPWPLRAFFSPLLGTQLETLGQSSTGLLIAFVLLTLPFLWIGVTMSVRRAADAGSSPWVGLAFLVPFVNYIVILVLSIAPPQAGERWNEGEEPKPIVGHGLMRALLGVVAAAMVGITMIGISIFGLGLYGTTLFPLTPCVMGTTAGLLFNRPTPRQLWSTLLVVAASHLIAGGVLAMFATDVDEIRWLLLLAMPPALAIGILGGIIGRAIAQRSVAPFARLAVS